MNQFFQHWADLFAMTASILLALVLTVRLQKKAPLRPVALFFLLFGPLVIVVHMSLHLLQNGSIAVMGMRNGAFVYHFRFYSLLLIGGLLAYVSLVFLQRCIYYAQHPAASRSQVGRSVGVIALISVPTIPFTPIGSLPLTACIITLIASLFLRKRPKEERGVAAVTHQKKAPVLHQPVFEEADFHVVPELQLHAAMQKHQLQKGEKETSNDNVVP